MELLNQYFELQRQIYEYFGCTEGYRIISLSDDTQYYWWCDGDAVGFAETEAELASQEGNYYENRVYKQRFLAQWVYEGQDYTMICVNTQADGNKLLQVFDNAKRRDVPSD